MIPLQNGGGNKNNVKLLLTKSDLKKIFNSYDI